MILLIDIGNTRLKWALEKEGLLGESQAIFHQKKSFTSQLKKEWGSLPRPNAIGISCVSSNKIKARVIAIAKEYWNEVEIIVATSSKHAFGVTNNYLHPHKLGVDRWLCLISSYYYYQQAVWVIDCGTAVTIDLINESGQHQGGVISAGLQLMKTALSTQTDGLRFIDKNYPLGLSNQTDKAIFSGTLYAIIGLIEQLLVQYPDKPMLILTGGDAKTVAKNLLHPTHIEPNLVLKGLALYTQKYL